MFENGHFINKVFTVLFLSVARREARSLEGGSSLSYPTTLAGEVISLFDTIRDLFPSWDILEMGWANFNAPPTLIYPKAIGTLTVFFFFYFIFSQ
jgi:hypothetical protein